MSDPLNKLLKTGQLTKAVDDIGRKLQDLARGLAALEKSFASQESAAAAARAKPPAAAAPPPVDADKLLAELRMLSPTELRKLVAANGAAS